MRVVLGVDRYCLGDGISRVVATSAKLLTELGHEAIVLCGKTDGKLEGDVIMTSYFKNLVQSNPVAAHKRIISLKPDIFYSHYYPMDTAGFLAHLNGLPHVMHWHGIAGLALRRSPGMAIGWARAKTSALLGSIGSDRILSISNFSAKQISGFKLNRSEIITVGNPIDTNFFSPSPNDGGYKSESSTNESSVPIILAVAGFTPHKGHIRLLRMARILRDRGVRFGLILAGNIRSGSQQYIEQLKEIIVSENLQKEVSLIGNIDDSILLNLYRNCTIFAYGSYWEGFGLPVAEAMACAKPVISYNIPAISEIIENERTGLLIKNNDFTGFADAVEILLRDETRRKNIGKGARESIETRYSFDIYGRRLLENLRGCLKENAE